MAKRKKALKSDAVHDILGKDPFMGAFRPIGYAPDPDIQQNKNSPYHLRKSLDQNYAAFTQLLGRRKKLEALLRTGSDKLTLDEIVSRYVDVSARENGRRRAIGKLLKKLEQRKAPVSEKKLAQKYPRFLEQPALTLKQINSTVITQPVFAMPLTKGASSDASAFSYGSDDDIDFSELDLSRISVPLPAARVRTDGMAQSVSREGQSEFRKRVIETYKRCVVTGCQVHAALDAAHIIPYVDERSNIVSNGLCLRTDIHRLFDANLLRLSGEHTVWVGVDLINSEYYKYNDQPISLPASPSSVPDAYLLSIRHRFIRLE